MQEALVAARRSGGPDTLLLLEHPAVVTLGRGADRGNLVADETELARMGIELFDCGRGGDVTYHGPGQLVGYPIVGLPPARRDAHRYLRDLEQALIRTAADYGVRAGRVAGLTGIWVGSAKLAAIGVRLSTGWITSHGFAFNVAGDLSGFETIVPCGLAGREITSLARLTGQQHPLREVAARAAHHLADVLDLRAVPSGDPAERLAVPPDPRVCWNRTGPEPSMECS
jgi:lipoyl(octanoyl) transferase